MMRIGWIIFFAIFSMTSMVSVFGGEPQLHFKFDEASGTTAADSSGNNIPGTLTGGPAFNPTGGRIKGAVVLDGIDDHVRIDNSAILNFADAEPFTFSAWVRTTDIAGPIIAFRNSAVDNALIALCVGFNGATTANGRLTTIVRGDAGGGFGQITSANAINDGNWHFVALVRTPTQIELFVDGVSVGTSNAAQALTAISSNERAVGAELRWINANVNTADQRYLNGTVDSVRVHKRALSAAELLDLATPDTTTTVVSGPTPANVNDNVTMTATVANARTTPNAGTVSFFNGATNLGTANVVNGVATFQTTALAPGNYTIAGVYSGEEQWAGSTSSAVNQSVLAGATTTTLTGPATTVFGQPATFTIAVAVNAPVTGTATGTVTLRDGMTPIGTATLSAGQATITIPALSVGAHALTAVYAGSTNFLTSTSATLNHTVNPASTQTAIASSLNPAAVGQAVTFTATVSAVAPSVGTVPTGTVTFTVDSVAQTPVALVNGMATLTQTLSGGGHTISATYSGSANFTGSASTNLTQNVLIPPVATPQSLVVGQGQSVAITLSGTDSGSLPLTFSIVTPPQFGTLSGTAPNVTYTPANGFAGTDTFTFLVNNTQLNSLPATVTLNVLPPPSFNSVPTFVPNPVLAGQTVNAVAGAGNASLIWNWGDGSADSGASHAYAQSGVYTVTVTAVDPVTGLTSTQTATVFVAAGVESNGGSGGGATPPGVVGVLVGGSGAGQGTGKIVCNYVRREKSMYSGSLTRLVLPNGMTQSDLAFTSCMLTLGTGNGAQTFYFELSEKGKGRATELPQIELSVAKRSFKFKAKRPALTELTEALGAPREFEKANRKPVDIFVPATVQIGTKLFLAMTFKVRYQQVGDSGKGALTP